MLGVPSALVWVRPKPHPPLVGRLLIDRPYRPNCTEEREFDGLPGSDRVVCLVVGRKKRAPPRACGPEGGGHKAVRRTNVAASVRRRLGCRRSPDWFISFHNHWPWLEYPNCQYLLANTANKKPITPLP